MIVFKYKENEYSVKFRRNDTSYTCEIKENDDLLLSTGESTLGRKDVFNKDKGRRVALKKALFNLDEMLGKDVEFNIKIWKLYNERNTVPKYNEIWIDDMGEIFKVGKGVKVVLRA